MLTYIFEELFECLIVRVSLMVLLIDYKDATIDGLQLRLDPALTLLVLLALLKASS